MRFPLAYRESILTVVCDDGLRDAAFDGLFIIDYPLSCIT